MKDIVERIDEWFAPFMAGLKAGRKGGGGDSKSKPLPTGARFGKLDDLYREVLYSTETDSKKAVEKVIKDNNLDKKTANALRKHVKKNLRR